MRKKVTKRKRVKALKPIEFIVMNDKAEVWIGLKGGYPVFSSNFDEAKPLQTMEQFQTLQSVSATKLEMLQN